MDFSTLSSLPILDNSARDWTIALAAVAGLFLALLVARRVVRRQHARFAATDRTELLELPFEVLSKTTLPFFLMVSVFVGLGTLPMSERMDRILGSAITIALFWQSGVWLTAAVTAWLERKRRRGAANDRAVVSSLAIVSFIAQVLIWAMVLLLTLDNLGVDITALVAGLGIGGIAVALAVQNVLGDLLASLSITLDRPFVIGDFLIVDEFLGAVEYIGIKSTRLRSLGGEQIVMSNADLLKSRVRNYGRMLERRVVFSISVVYDTSAELLERIPKLIRDAIEENPKTRFDRSHFASYGPSSLDFETVYYVLSGDYNQYMDIQQNINLRLFRGFAKLDIKFAHPMQLLYHAPIEIRPGDHVDRNRKGAEA